MAKSIAPPVLPLERPKLPKVKKIHRLEPADRLDQPTFHARYELMPPGTKAELIEGVVHIPSPARRKHGFANSATSYWLGGYVASTPGVETGDNLTVILGKRNEPQPDHLLAILPEFGGAMQVDENDYFRGAAELIVEVALSTESIDMHAKKRMYEKFGVREYVVVLLRSRKVVWFVLSDGIYVEIVAAPDGIFRSQVFPGLWLDPAALIARDRKRLFEVLEQGLATPEHAAFVAELQKRRPVGDHA